MIEKLKLKAKIVIPAFVLCAMLSSFPLPFRLGNAMYYMLFFYVGYILQKDGISLDRFYTLKYCLIAIVAFCILFPSLTLLKTSIMSNNGGGVFLC